MSLPERFERMKSLNLACIQPDNQIRLLAEALTIAVPALEKLGICDCRDGYGRPRKHRKMCASVISKEALRRIAELGGGTSKGIGGNTQPRPKTEAELARLQREGLE